MEINIFLCQVLIWVILLLGQLHGCKSCSEIERNALLELNKYVISRSDESYLDYVLPSWTKDTKSDCCRWKGVECNRTSSRVIGISIGEVNFKERTPLNLSLLHRFEEVKSLNLSGKGHKNKFNGFFDDVEGYKSLRRLRNLEILDLSSNFFNNSIFPFLNAATSLTTLFLRDNKMDGPLPTKYLKELANLELLDLSWNNFNGSMSGLFSLNPLTNLTKLKVFKLSSTSDMVRVETERSWQPKFKLDVVVLRFCSLEKIPSFLVYQKNLRLIDLSNNRLSGNIPTWILENNLELQVLRLQNNSFTNFRMPTIVHSLQVLDFSSNDIRLFPDNIGRNGWLQEWVPREVSIIYGGHFLLKGLGFTSLTVLRIQNNLFTGRIGAGLLSSSMLSYIDMSDNRLTGTIPPSLVVMSSVSFLDLSGNLFSGPLPSYVSYSVKYLFLHNNNFTGPIPETLLRNVEILDLRNYNPFHVISTIPTFVVEELESFYIIYQTIEIQFAAKQRYDTYAGVSMFTEGILGYMYGMDLSNNQLRGIIPTELGNLSKLRALNLSHNLLSGSIPSSFSNLKDIESLDLSYNVLHGSIPYQLANLTSLAVFNVSYNNLSGIILQGNQFSTFKENSYLGNPLLCGLPTSKSCEAKKSSEEAHNGEEEINDEAAFDMLFFYYSTASTYVTALIGIVVLMCLDCPWSRAWFCIVDAFIAFAKNIFA
ncbi:hypothetical protein DY000_02034153 [Brassica cretica]|uniref:Leucine-rich repeat-containing N-terminal plant-type domain-containing protein n=1 Tax=Brassica cretica TaxID=69181 RepID=A0ABQ7DV83_BRACR|nr:hypothetical protein DY000_02034153 [Brassica cretica]